MSLLTGKDMVTLLHENILDPLGEGLVTQTNLGFGAAYTADFLARVGQMLLNRGAYGPYWFYSPRGWNRLEELTIDPCPQSAGAEPDVDRSFPIGSCRSVGSCVASALTWSRDRNPHPAP